MPEVGQATDEAAAADGVLKLLSWNIQAGVNSSRFSDYLTHSWKHVLPHRGRVQVMDRIAALVARFDIVALQESDSGSLRTGFVNQTEYLAERGGFSYWRDQTNRRLGTVARHANGLLARVRPAAVAVHALPGVPGRGLIHARFDAGEPFDVLVVHLALGRRSRRRQIGFLAEVLRDCRHAVVMGDFNCTPESREMRLLTASVPLRAPPVSPATFPSWRPKRHLDHILVTPDIEMRRFYVPEWTCSDHLPVALEVVLPACCTLRRHAGAVLHR